MTTPKRPSLAATLALIDDTLAAQKPFPPPLPVLGEYISGIPLDVRPPRCRCVVTPIEPVIRDGDTFTVTKPGVYELTWNPGGSGEPSVAERALEPPPDPDWITFEKPGHLPGPPGPTCPGCAARDARPGWLARTLRRLFT